MLSISANTNLFNCICIYLSYKDILSLSQTNSHIYRSLNCFTNYLYRREMERTFFSNSLYVPSIMHYDSILHKLDIQKIISDCNWKQLFKSLVHVYNSFDTNDKCLNVFRDEFSKAKVEIFEAFKYHNYVNRLRKINYHLENHFNSPHQLFFMDYIEEENDIYDFYNKYFYALNKGEHSFIKEQSLPLQCFLIHFNQLKYLFENNLNDKQILNEIVLYQFNSFKHKYNVNNCSNPLIIFIDFVYKYTFLFSKMTYFFLKQYTCDNDSSILYAEIFLNEYLKRYESFVYTAISINEKFENLNVTVNYLYSYLYKEETSSSKFNMYKFMYNIFYNEVIIPLYNDNMIKQALTKFIHFNINDILLINKEVSSFTQYQMNKKYLLEELANSFLDLDSNEYTTKYINSTFMNTSLIYNDFCFILFNKIYQCINDKLRTNELTLNDTYIIFERICKDKIFNFINKTQLNLMQVIVTIMKEQIEQKLINVFTQLSVNNKSITSSGINVDFDKYDDNICNAFNKEMNEIVGMLTQYGIKKMNLNKEIAFNLATNVINWENNENVCFCKKVILTYYEELNVFEKINKKVEKIINKKQQPSIGCLINKKLSFDKAQKMKLEEVLINA